MYLVGLMLLKRGGGPCPEKCGVTRFEILPDGLAHRRPPGGSAMRDPVTESTVSASVTHRLSECGDRAFTIQSKSQLHTTVQRTSHKRVSFLGGGTHGTSGGRRSSAENGKLV